MRTKAFVVDTNVAIVANGKSPQADYECMSACVSALQDIHKKGIIVLDHQMHILSEYLKHLSQSGQPGVGDAFMRWVWDNQAVASRCERVTITPRGNLMDEDFEEFPDTPELRKFDKSDRKFAAVALSSTKNPKILNAVDPGWWRHQDALKKLGLSICFLCIQNMQ